MNKATIGDLIIENKSCQYGLALPAMNYDANKIRYLRISDIDDSGNLLEEDKKSIDAPNIENYILQPNELVVARTGNSTGRTYVYSKEDGKLAYAGFLIKYKFDDVKINPRYIKYFTISNIYKAQINGFNGSTRGNMNAQDFKNIEVIYPDRNIQDKMVTLFDLISAKIKNNNQIVTKLESLAKTIYDYWFLQFEFPNEDGKPYKSSGGKMVWNEELKREIPEGWEVSTIRKYVSRITNGLNPRKNFILGSGSNYYVTTKNLDNKGNIDFSTCDYISDDALDKINNRSDLKIGDVLFSGIATVGRVYLITEKPVNWNINEAIFTLRPAKGVSSYFLYNFCQSEEIQKQADLNAIGSSQRCLTQDHFLDIPCLNIPNNIQMKFEQKVKPIIDMRKMTENETQQLTSLRDFLLPLLMNGQVTFKDDVASEEE